MRTLRSIAAFVLVTCTLLPINVWSEDIDIYTGGQGGRDPNVLIVLDNESNWSATLDSNPPQGAIDLCGAKDAGSYFCAQKYALMTLLQAKNTTTNEYLIAKNVGIGIMMYGDSNNKGGYIRFGVRKMDVVNGVDNRAALIELLKNLNVNGDKGSSQQDYAMMMWEAFKYYGGGNVAAGGTVSATAYGPIPTNGVGSGTNTRDYPSNNVAGSAYKYGARSPFAYTSDSTDNSGANPPVKYNPPELTGECGGQNYIVYIGHSNSQDDTADNQPPVTYFQNVGGLSTRVMAGNKEVTGSYGDEATRYLFNTDVDPRSTGKQNVITYTIGTYDAPCVGQICSMITTMKSMAYQGGGSYYDATNIKALIDAFMAIFTEIQSVDSVFVSSSLPLSVNTQGTYLNQVYVGMFRPDPDNSPKWVGNLKQYKLAYDSATNTLRLVDSTGLGAVDATSGFISSLATSYWTTSSTYWSNWLASGRTKSASDAPDGPEVQKGGAAQRQREVYLTSQTARKVYTCAINGTTGLPACATGSLSGAPFTTATLPTASAGTKLAFNYPTAWATTTSADTDITNLIAWVRGQDNATSSPPEYGPGGTTTVRPTIHGDLLHSTPVALNFSGRVVTFYGSNEGMLRAVEGKQTGTGAGNELWAFVAPEHLGKLQRLRQQSPKLVLPSKPGSIYNKDYFFDGPIGAYQEGSTAIIYVAVRRGGNFIYAFDVSNPDDPQFKFRLSPSTSGMSNLGQTWSLPKPMKVRYGTSERLVLIFGGGYDPAEDSGTTGTTGRGVYVVDALTGNVLKHFLSNGTDSFSASVPSEVSVIDSNRDGYIDRAYVGDMNGDVWRMDLDDGTATTSESTWALHKLASLGTTRKFFYPPDAVLTPTFTAVLIGSGNREQPLDETSTDRFYMVKDAKTALSGAGQDTIKEVDLVANSSTQAQIDAAKGWYLALRDGEKAVNAPLTIGGVTYFGTNRPLQNLTCERTDLGEARSYAMKFFYGEGARPPEGGSGDDDYSMVLTGGGLPPSPVAGLVDMGGGLIVPFCLGCGDRRSPLEAGVPTKDPSPVRRKLYWKVKKDK